ncbi:MAG: TA system VapC family ribonuclease toxin [Gemmatimonas sp.]
MIAVDTNVLVQAHRQDAPFHTAARATLGELAAGPSPWAIPWPCVHEFLAIVTHPRIFKTPTPLAAACDQIDAWLEVPTIRLLSEDRDAHWSSLKPLLTNARITGPRVHDARVAALCAAHGVSVLLSADRDFSRFPALDVRNPLV